MQNEAPNQTPGRPSFLDEILASTTESSQQTSVPPSSGGAPNPNNQKPKTSIPPGQILRIIGGLFFVALVFFGSFLSYIVFNPGQARFFINFGINPGDVASLLATLVNGIFGTLSFFLSALFAYVLFKMYISKGNPRRRAVFGIASLFVGILLFSNIGFWAFLFEKIGASDFVRPTGGVIVYDNDLFLSERFASQAELMDTSNLIGPITLRYDLSSDARYASRAIEIESFSIDCGDGTTLLEGTNPIGDTGLTCQYNLRKNFTPTGFYIGRDTVTHEPKKIAITFPAVKVSGVVDVKRSGSNVVLDGSDLLQVANIRWYTGETFDTLASSDSKFTLKTENQEQYVCLSLAAPSQKRESCARIFAIRPKVDSPITGTIQYEVDPTDSTKYAFRIVDLKTKTGGEIERIAWYLDDTIPMGNDESAEKSFPSYGTYKVSAEITDSAGNKVTLSEKITLQKPLQLVKKSGSDSLLSVKDQSGNQLLKNAYDRELGAYRIENFQTPQKIMFDATDVRVKNDGFELKEVSWKIGNEERKGMKLEYDFVEERRYEVTVQYIFVKTGTTEEVSVTEKIVLEGKAKEIMPALSMSSEGQADLDNLYAPARITFDASASRVRSGKIAQFIFDFGEGKPASEGEAVKTYQYTIPGEYPVTLTVVKDDGTKESLSRKIVIKDVPKQLQISASVATGIAGKTVEFSTQGTVGQVEKYAWDFGDGTEAASEPNPVHTFVRAGKYEVKATVTYVDGTIRTAEMEFVVE